MSATNNLTITAPGKTTLNGAEATGQHITLNTGNLAITSPQDSSHYKSNATQAGMHISVPILGSSGNTSVGGSYGNQKIKDNYQSTGKKLSGLYAGNGGLDVHVGDETHLVAGVISSTADQSKNRFETGRLVAESVVNQSKWKATATSGGFSIGSGSMGSMTGILGTIGSNLAANSGLINGTQRKHDEESISHSAISDNITVHAGSVQGNYVTTVEDANGHLDNKFNAQKLQNELQNSQLGMQLVGEVMGQISDELHKEGVGGFDETKPEDDYGRVILEAGGSAAVAAITGGNAGASAVSSAAGSIAASAAWNSIYQWAEDNHKQGEKAPLTVSEINTIENAIASAGGAAAGAAIGGGSGALNGMGIASTIQQYNMTQATHDYLEIAKYGAMSLMERPNHPYVEGGLLVAIAGIEGILLLDPVDQPNQGQQTHNQDNSQHNQNVVQGDKNDSVNTSGSGGSGSNPDPNDNQEPSNDQDKDNQDQNQQRRPDQTPSPALSDSPYNPDVVDNRIKPAYKPNPAHDQGSSLYNPDKTPEPADAEQAYYQNTTIRYQSSQTSSPTWYAQGEKGIYTYYSDNAGGVHFIGMNEKIPEAIRTYFKNIK